MNNLNQWSKITRWLHASIALSLTIQLVLSLVLVPPDEFDEAGSLGIWAMEGHEIIGLVAAGLLFLHWLWMFLPNNDVKLTNLFPFLKAGGVQQIKSQIQYVMKEQKLPDASEHGGLAGLIHGFGILIATAVAVSGVGLYVVMEYSSKGFENPLFENIAEVHELFGNLMWFYLIAHVLAAGWHEYAGERIISRMFRV